MITVYALTLAYSFCSIWTPLIMKEILCISQNYIPKLYGFILWIYWLTRKSAICIEKLNMNGLIFEFLFNLITYSVDNNPCDNWTCKKSSFWYMIIMLYLVPYSSLDQQGSKLVSFSTNMIRIWLIGTPVLHIKIGMCERNMYSISSYFMYILINVWKIIYKSFDVHANYGCTPHEMSP